MNHGMGIADDDKRLTIDPDSRTITSQSGKIVMVQYDHDSERLTFECPRIVEGHDMLESDFVEVLYMDSAKAHGLYVSDDMHVEGDKVIFSWLVSRNATRKTGTLGFLVRFVCLDEAGNITYEWHTALFKKAQIVEGMAAGDILDEYPDALNQWRDEVIENAITTEGHDDTVIKMLIEADALPCVALNGEILSDGTDILMM